MVFVSFQIKGTSTSKQRCRFTDDSDDCDFFASFEEVNNTIMVQVESEKG